VNGGASLKASVFLTTLLLNLFLSIMIFAACV
jgi:hypothetical protein